MKVDIYILGERLDVYDRAGVSITRQVNEFTELGSRQFNYTNRFKLPKTARNKRILNFLSYAGNTSDAPYIRIDGAKMNFNGIPIVSDGYAELQDTDSDYNIVIYDGAVNFYEAIKDLKLQNLDWNDTNHTYDTSTVKDSWQLNDKYVYPHIQTSESQPFEPTFRPQLYFLEQPAPVVYVKDVFEKIGQLTGYTIQGSMISDPLFQNAVVTTEKGLELDFQETNEIFDSTESKTYTTETIESEQEFPAASTASGFYKVKATVTFSSTNNTSAQMKVYQGFNLVDVIEITDDFEYEFLGYGNRFSLDYTLINLDGIQSSITSRLQVFEIENSALVDFTSLFDKVKIKDFIGAIMVKFCSNISVDNFNKTVSFDFIDDIDNASVNDLSKYFISNTGESYKIGDYVQNNEFIYTLQDSELDTSKGTLLFSENRKETKTHYTSLFTQADEVGTDYYKHIVYSDRKPKSSGIKIGVLKTIDSDIELTFQDVVQQNLVNANRGELVNQYITFDFEPFHFDKLITSYYQFLQQKVFNAPLKKRVNLAIPLIVFHNLNLQEKVYLKQLGAEFIINKIKINNSGFTSAELIKISESVTVDTEPVALITGNKEYTTDSPGLTHTFTLSGKDSTAPNSSISDFSWNIYDETSTIVQAGDGPEISFDVPPGESWLAELRITAANGLQDTDTCTVDNNISIPFQSFTEIETIAFDETYSLIGLKLNGTPNTDFQLQISTSESKPTVQSRVTVYRADATNCWLNATDFPLGNNCLEYGSFPGPGIFNVTVPLDNDGCARIQMVFRGGQWRYDQWTLPQIPVFTSASIKDLTTNNTKSIFSRAWTLLLDSGGIE